MEAGVYMLFKRLLACKPPSASDECAKDQVSGGVTMGCQSGAFTK